MIHPMSLQTRHFLFSTALAQTPSKCPDETSQKSATHFLSLLNSVASWILRNFTWAFLGCSTDTNTVPSSWSMMVYLVFFFFPEVSCVEIPWRKQRMSRASTENCRRVPHLTVGISTMLFCLWVNFPKVSCAVLFRSNLCWECLKDANEPATTTAGTLQAKTTSHRPYTSIFSPHTFCQFRNRQRRLWFIHMHIRFCCSFFFWG